MLDRPWEGPQSAYGTVLHDGTRYLLYYRGGGDLAQEVTCLATSSDGVSWERPRIGLIEFDGSRDNNIIFKAEERKSYGESHNFSPFVDRNPVAVPGERFKAVALRRFNDDRGESQRMLVALASPDGIRWHRMTDGPIIREGGGFDSLNVAFWDHHIDRYVCYSRVGLDGYRSIQRSTSVDFLNWDPPQPLSFVKNPDTHFYTNGIQPLPGDGRLYIGLPMRFLPGRKTFGEPPVPTDGLSDAVLITSRDGLDFNFDFREALIRPGLNPGNWGNAHGNNTPLTGVVETAPGEWSMYWFENYGSTAPCIRRGTMREGGFVSIHADHAGGSATTPPVKLEATDTLVLNASTSAAGSIRVEAIGPAGETLLDSSEFWGDAIELAVPGFSPEALEPLLGREVRLRFTLRDADLYGYAY